MLEESLFYSDPSPRPGEEGQVFREWLLAMLLDALDTMNRVRAAAGAPDAQYGLDFELHGVGVAPSLASWSSRAFPLGRPD